MTVCEICGQLSMHTITICFDCREEARENLSFYDEEDDDDEFCSCADPNCNDPECNL